MKERKAGATQAFVRTQGKPFAAYPFQKEHAVDRKKPEYIVHIEHGIAFQYSVDGIFVIIFGSGYDIHLVCKRDLGIRNDRGKHQGMCTQMPGAGTFPA